VVSKPPLEPKLSRQSSAGQVRGKKRLILEIPDEWIFIPPVSGGAVKRFFPALILDPSEAFETTSNI
jgi:hypothetical protein